LLIYENDGQYLDAVTKQVFAIFIDEFMINLTIDNDGIPKEGALEGQRKDY